ncbi:N-acyl-D-amino-acid deacylase family protein [Cupriavidus pinatubonensis]|uniref:Allantoinase n=1 Tax=Cupriavidus pinatubonensis TaxID=248026 RepID=A0ABM8Y2F5_9BURK|nr:amidohydrolase family protein [Cupriavidus pinatubonensis]CAG9186933.1 Allantoinase [Cupriavidus pinatubonensis]
MTTAYDVVIRGGKVIDGSGEPARIADVAVLDGKIERIGEVKGKGREEIDAAGQIVTPGFIDIHTHYDGQVTWENRLIPSSNHGVTTVVMGNCGVGFAPCKAEDREALVRVMEGVEDIPEIVMSAGIPWNWETFPEYLDSLQAGQYDIDFAAQVPHSAVRVYVMGERGERREVATADELHQMTSIVRDAVRAGAVGVSTSQHLGHRTVEGELAPSIGAGHDEVLALARGLREAGGGVFQIITDGFYGGSDAETQMQLLRSIAETSGRPVSYSLVQKAPYINLHESLLKLTRQAQSEGYPIKAQVFPRPVGLLFGLGLSLHPFRFHPSYLEVHDRPLPERVAALRDPRRRAAILSEQPVHTNPIYILLVSQYDNAFLLGDPPNYEPGPEAFLATQARHRGITLAERTYDLLIENGGHNVLLNPASNFAEGNLKAVHRMLVDDHTLVALGDGGAHYGMICDSSYPTTVLSYWTRDREHDRVPLEWAVHRLSRNNALALGMTDRGLLAEGLKADINVIDYDRLRLHPPKPVFSLPGGARRLEQTADGYTATLVSGQVTYRNGVPTGALPGRLVRGRLSA